MKKSVATTKKKLANDSFRVHKRRTQKKSGNGSGIRKSKHPMVTIDKYKNGFTLLYEPSLSPTLGLTCIYLFVHLGSSDEPSDLKGVSHLIEHMMFKGTKTHKQDTLLRVFDSTGSKFNAYTTKNVTCYYIVCASEHTQNCLDALSEMLMHAIFDDKELEKEQRVVYEENIQDESDSDILLEYGMNMGLFKGTPYESPIDYIHAPLNRKKVIDYYSRYYLPEKMVLSIVSSEPYHFIKQIVNTNPLSQVCQYHRQASKSDTNFTKIMCSSDVKTEIPTPNKKFELYREINGTKVVCIKTSDTNNIQVAIGFPTCGWKNIKDRKTLKLIKLLFSRGLNGYLYNILREKHGLTYSPNVNTEYYNTVGKFTLYVETECTKIFSFRENGKKKKGVLPILFELLCQFIQKGPTEREWEDVKGYYYGEQMIHMEKSKHLAEYNGKNYLFSLSDHQKATVTEKEKNSKMDSYLSHWEKHIRPLTLQDCRDCIRTYFVPTAMCIVLVGGSIPSIHRLEKCMNTYFQCSNK